jgi:dTDP-4-dehydrorhamnose 3,5-epimerase
MQILDLKSLDIPDIKVIRFKRFCDHRGYFTEPTRQSDLQTIACLRDVSFVQTNESFSKAGVVRGLHFQWNPFMGKLVRTVQGRMVDLFLDIRKGSPSFGQAMAYAMPSSTDMDYAEWIWVPPGFAHGNYFTEDSTIEYFCTGEYSPRCEAGISPIASDIDWSLCDEDLKAEFDALLAAGAILSDKDRDGMTFSEWQEDPRSNEFIFRNLQGTELAYE